MATERIGRKSDIYQIGVSVSGMLLWLISVAATIAGYGWREQLMFVALVPVVLSLSRFVQHFRLPMGLTFTRERITFTLTDAFVLLVACWFGMVPAVFLAGVDGFISSRGTVRRLSSNLFSSAMMSLGAAAAASSIGAVLYYGFGETAGTGHNHTLLAIAVALLVGSIVQLASNIALFSTLLALRHDNPTVDVLKGFLWTVPMFLPNSAAATLMYYALQHDPIIIVVIGVPLFLAVYFGQRQSRDGVQKRIAVMEKAHRETIEALAVAINAKDEVTHAHVLRVQIYAAGVARALGCTRDEIEALKAGALLHDIGKIAVPDYILTKPGKLTATEFEKMKIHTIAGARILSRVEFPYPIVPVVRHHHERWDGEGYPDGLSGEDIPLTARILTVVDSFDAVREDRQYRKAMTREEAIDLIIQGSGSLYDPRVVGTFVAHLPQLEAEIKSHRDSPLPTFGIEPSEQLSEAARLVLPAAGIAEEEPDKPFSERAPDEIKALCNLAKAVISAAGENEIAAAFTEALNSVIPYCTCAITLVDPATGISTVTSAAGRDGLFLRGRTIAPGEGVTGWVLANRKPFCNADPKLDLPPSVIGQSSDYRTLAAFPIINGAVMFGAVTVYSSDLNEYTQAHQKLMEEAVSLMGSALAASHPDPWKKKKRASDEVDCLSPLAEALAIVASGLENELTH